jgi:hypothetical protein
MDPEIRKAIATIDQRIADLQQAKAALLQAFGEQEAVATTSRPTVLRSAPRSRARNTNPASPGKRKAELAHFLVTHGPAKRGEIVARSGIPEGTIANLLSKSPEFILQRDGRWNVKQGELLTKGEPELVAQ